MNMKSKEFWATSKTGYIIRVILVSNWIIFWNFGLGNADQLK